LFLKITARSGAIVVTYVLSILVLLDLLLLENAAPRARLARNLSLETTEIGDVGNVIGCKSEAIEKLVNACCNRR
jgi:hypothetical protein